MLFKHSQLKNRLSFDVWFLLLCTGFLVRLLAWIYACLKLCHFLSYILMVDRPQVESARTSGSFSSEVLFLIACFYKF